MTLAWFWPWALLGAAALLAPLLLHLDRRRSLQPLRFAALRWLDARQRPRRTWQLRERWLLLLRLLLVAALVLWLAQPLLHGAWRAPRVWTAVVPGVAPGVDAASGPRVWLAPEFPPIDDASAPSARDPSSLLRELDTLLAPDDTLVVRVPPTLRGLDAAALSLSHAVEWQVDETASAETLAAPRTPPLLALRHASADAPALRPLRAAIAAWAVSDRLAVTLDDAPLGVPIPAQARAAIVLHAGPAPELDAIARAGATVLAIDTAAGADAEAAWPPPITRVGSGRLLRLPPDPARVPGLQDAAFPQQLHRLLFALPPPSLARAADVAPMRSGAALPPPATPLQPLLAWLVVLLFLLERIVASGRRGTPSP